MMSYYTLRFEISEILLSSSSKNLEEITKIFIPVQSQISLTDSLKQGWYKLGNLANQIYVIRRIRETRERIIKFRSNQGKILSTLSTIWIWPKLVFLLFCASWCVYVCECSFYVLYFSPVEWAGCRFSALQVKLTELILQI